MKEKLCVAVLLSLLVTSALSWSAEESKPVFEAGPSQNTALQLFTSDASANGNTALQWFGDLKNRDSQKLELWKSLFPMALHVHQWDIPGYKDTFAQKEFDALLLAYKNRWGATQVYSPTLAVNGVEWSGWSRGQNIPFSRDNKTGILTVGGTKREGVYEATFKPEKTLRTEGFTLHGALLAFGLTSRPSEGKNRGKVLAQDFIAVLYRMHDFRESYGALTSSVEILPNKKQHYEHTAVVFWVTYQSDPFPLQVTGGMLS